MIGILICLFMFFVLVYFENLDSIMFKWKPKEDGVEMICMDTKKKSLIMCCTFLSSNFLDKTNIQGFTY